MSVVVTDPVRKDLHCVGDTERLGADAYREDITRAVYREVGRRAARRLADHGGVIVDASARTRELRAELLAPLTEADPVVAVTCRVPEPLQAGRARGRLADPGRVSDADPGVAAALAAEFEPIETAAGIELAITVQTDQPVHDAVDELAAALDRAETAPDRVDGDDLLAVLDPAGRLQERGPGSMS